MNRHGHAASVEQVALRHLAELLQQTAQGDQHAFAAFYQLTSRRVYALARRILVDPVMAQDSTQDAYLMVWQEAHKYDPSTGSPMAWLMTIAHRRAVDKVRSERAHTNREAHWNRTSLGVEYDVVAETVGDRLEAQDVVKYLGRLSALQREAITLAFYRGLTYKEVAEHLCVPLPTVKSRIRDGIKHLRACMER